jgi:hypothetical protein
MMDSEPTRALWFVDRSRNSEGEKAELGWGRGLVVGVVDAVDEKTGRISQVRQAYLQPRNWHLSEGEPIFDDFPDLLDRRLSTQLIADSEHDPSGFHMIEPEDNESAPNANDWDFDCKSTRIIDYHDPGHTALFSQLVKVIDDGLEQYTAAIKLNRVTGGHEQAASGYVWDESLNQSGLLDTVFILNQADRYGDGRDGTPWGILGIRSDAHFEWTNGEEPDGAGGDKHGAIHFSTTDVSGFQEMPLVGARYKAAIFWDPTQKNKNSGLGLETGHWRPAYVIPQICNETPPNDGPVGYPGSPAADGSMISLQPCTGSAAPPAAATFCSLRTVSSGGTNTLQVSQPDGSWSPVSGGGGGASPCHFGDGSDGTFTADGSSTPAWATYASNAYTLQRDVTLDTLTIAGGYKIKTGGYRLLTKSTTINSGGVIHNDGTAGGLIASYTKGQTPAFGSIGNGSDGGQGAVTNANGSTPSSLNNGVGGTGGNGGNAAAFTGGFGGSISPLSAQQGTWRAMPQAVLGYTIGGFTSTQATAIRGGSGGGGGAAGNGANTAGGGGGGGGVLIFTAKTLVNNGVIRANGGDGGNADGGLDATAVGGGGGGGGGCVIVAYGTKSGSGTITATGGAAGTGAHTGANGSVGVDGQVMQLC